MCVGGGGGREGSRADQVRTYSMYSTVSQESFHTRKLCVNLTRYMSPTSPQTDKNVKRKKLFGVIASFASNPEYLLHLASKKTKRAPGGHPYMHGRQMSTNDKNTTYSDRPFEKYSCTENLP